MDKCLADRADFNSSGARGQRTLRFRVGDTVTRVRGRNATMADGLTGRVVHIAWTKITVRWTEPSGYTFTQDLYAECLRRVE